MYVAPPSTSNQDGKPALKTAAPPPVHYLTIALLSEDIMKITLPIHLLIAQHTERSKPALTVSIGAIPTDMFFPVTTKDVEFEFDEDILKEAEKHFIAKVINPTLLDSNEKKIDRVKSAFRNIVPIK